MGYHCCVRGACIASFVLFVASPAMAQDDWIARARQDIADARYDSARMDLGRAEEASDAAEHVEEIATTRDALLRAESSGTVSWTHGVSLGLFGGAAFAAGTSAGFVAWSFALGLGNPRSCFDCSYWPPEPVFAFGVASGVSALALLAFAAWLATDGVSIEARPPIVPVASVGTDGLWLGVSGLL